MQVVLKWGWAGAVVFGLVLAVAGGYMVREARQAHDEVRDTLSSERIITAEDADIPLAAVTGPEEAKAQADAVRAHTLKITGGKTYAELARDDPNRATYLNSITLRTALMESYLAFKIADLVAGVGIIVSTARAQPDRAGSLSRHGCYATTVDGRRCGRRPGRAGGSVSCG